MRSLGVRDLRSDKQTHADLDLLVADADSVVVVEELVERTDAGYRFGRLQPDSGNLPSGNLPSGNLTERILCP